MEDILHLVTKVEQKATAIIDLANKEKEELKSKEEGSRNEFLEYKTLECENELKELRLKSEQEVERQKLQLEEESKESTNQLKDYYVSHKSDMVSELIQQITGE